MTPEKHRQISALFQEAVELPAEQRRAFLDERCAGDAEMRREVESLLQHHHDLPDAFDDQNVGLGRALLNEPAGRAVSLPAQIGRFRILRRIGEGGMGVVFEAQQGNPSRTVALKVIRAGLATDSVVRRFRHEAEVLARLQHPGIADVYEAGVAETPLGQQPYFAMQLIKGLPLLEFARQQGLELRARLELFARICDAVQYAHQRGVIHRDLKPANMLVDADGQPKILDFGVARVTDGDLTLATMQTSTGQVIGTLPYMSPEQVSGRAVDVDTRSDVYALGVSLYELLAERLPYSVSNCTLPEAARIIVEVDPTPLSGFDRRMRGDIETIVFKALQKDRAQRYQAVAEFAADIRRYLADEPVLARPPSAMYQLRKFARRNTGLVVGVLAVFASLIFGIAGVSWFAAGESRQRAAAEAATAAARRMAYRVSVGAAADALEDHNILAARRLLAESPAELRGWEWRHLSQKLDDSSFALPGLLPPGGWVQVRADGDAVVRNLQSVLRIDVQKGVVSRRESSIAGGPIAVNAAGTAVAVVTSPRQVVVRSLDETHEVALPPLDEDVYSLAFDQAATCLLVGGRKGAATLVDLPTGAVRWRADLGRVLLEFSFSPSGEVLAGSDFAGNLVLRANDGSVLYDLKANGTPRFPRAVWSRDGRLLYRRELGDSGRRNTVVAVVAATGERLPPWPVREREILSFDLSTDGTRALTSYGDRSICVHDAATGQVLHEFLAAGGEPVGTIFTPDAAQIAFTELSGLVQLMDAETGRLLASLRGQEMAGAIEFSPDGRRLFGIARNGAIRGWDLAAAADANLIRGHTSFVYPVQFSPDGQTLASGSWDRTIRLWDVCTRRERKVLSGHDTPVTAVSFSPDGRWLLSRGLSDKRDYLWRLEDGTFTRLPERQVDTEDLPAFLKDGRRVWLPGAPGQAVEQAWDAETGAVTTISPAELCGSDSPCVDPRGQWLARIVGTPLKLILANIRQPTVIRTVASDVGRAVFNADGSQIVAVPSQANALLDSAFVWDVTSGAKVMALAGHIGQVYDARFSPDGSRLATCARDGTIRIWGGASFDSLVRLRGHEDYVWSIAWSPDGRTLASGSGDKTVRLWRSGD